jgi:hypothetical protein
LAWQLNTSIKRFNAENDIAKIQPVRDVKKIPVGGTLPPMPAPRRYNPGEFEIIPAQNLFSETRTREEKVEAPPVPESPPLDVKPVLVGVAVTGNQRQALIIDPSNTAGGRKTLRRKLGDTFRGYTITDITMNNMVLQSGARREVIPLFDGAKHPSTGGKTAIVATRVVAFGSTGPAAGGTVGAAQPAQAGVTSPARGGVAGAAPSTTAARNQAATPPGQAGITRGAQQPQQPMPAPGASTGPSWNERLDDQGRRVIRTPFGDIVRPNQPNP